MTARLEKMDAALKKAMRATRYVFVPGVLYIVVRWTTSVQSTVVNLVGLVVSLGALAFAVFTISTEKRRQCIARAGWRWALSYASALAVVSTAVFAGVTLELVRAGWIELVPTPTTPDGLVDFYMWHLLNLLPGSVPSTLMWSPGFTYEQSRVGVVVVFYTLVVATPAVALLRDTVRVRRRGPDDLLSAECAGWNSPIKQLLARWTWTDRLGQRFGSAQPPPPEPGTGSPP